MMLQQAPAESATDARQRRFLLTVRRALLLIVAWIDQEYHLGKQDRG
jgi:hypothetical protein